MRVPRPKGWLLLPLAGLALLAVLGPTLLSGAGSEPIVPGPCPADRAAAPPAGRVPGTWYRLDPVLDANGSLTGQRLEAGSYARRASFTLDLPPDAFAGGPFGEVVLFGTDDGTTSRLATLDLAAGCTVELVATSELVWRATIDPAGVTLYEQRLDRAGRSDAGVWRRSLADPTTAERVLEPAGAGPDEEPPFSIELVWSLAGDRLAVQSCGPATCRTRLLEPSSGTVTELAGDDQGEVLGLTASELVGYRAGCGGLPCPILAWPVDGGPARTVVADAGLAVVASDGGRPLLAFEQPGETRVAGVIRLDGDPGDVRIVRLPPGTRLQPSAARASGALVAPPGWLVAATEGRAIDRPGLAVRLVRAIDGRTAAPEEVIR